MSDETTLESNEQSIDETIAAKWAEIEARGDLSEEPEQPSGRDEKGRFAAKQDEQEESAPIEEKPSRKAPSSWKKEAQERYATLDPLFQDEIDRREADFHKGLESYKTKAQIADEWDRAIQPYKQTLDGFGVPAHQAVSNLLAVDQVLRYGSAEQKQQIFHGSQMITAFNSANNKPKKLTRNCSRFYKKFRHWSNAYKRKRRSEIDNVF